MKPDLRAAVEGVKRRRHDRAAPDVATMTLIVFFERQEVGHWARDRMHALSSKHPSRVIVLDGSHEGAPPPAPGKTRGDWIELAAKGYDIQTLHAAIETLCLPEAPCVLFWVAAGIDEDPRFASLANRMQTVVVSTSVLDPDSSALCELVSFSRRQPDATFSDLAYLRLAPWQESIALFFDRPDALGELFAIERVEIACGSDPEAYYLVGWLAARLGWTPHAVNDLRNHVGAHVEFAIVRQGAPRRIRRVELRSASSRFLAQIADERAEAIVLSVDGPHPHPPRCRPLNNVGLATLVERAILHGRGDRAFHEALAAAGAILDCRRE